VFVLALCILFPGSGRRACGSPNERQLSDRAAPPIDKDAAKPPVVEPVPAPTDSCVRTAPKDAAARSLTPRPRRGDATRSATATRRRLPFALMGLLTVLATAGSRCGSPVRARGLLAGIVLLSMRCSRSRRGC